MLHGFKTSRHESRWTTRLKNHDGRVVQWRGLVESVINGSRHDPGESNTIFFDDTKSTNFPNVTSRGLKDLTMGSFHAVDKGGIFVPTDIVPPEPGDFEMGDQGLFVRQGFTVPTRYVPTEERPRWSTEQETNDLRVMEVLYDMGLALITI